MNIIIFGAAGQTGRQLVRQALEQGNVVTAFAREPGKIKISHNNLILTQGDVLNQVQVDSVIPGKDAVLYAVGVTKNSPGDVVSRGLKNVITSMQKYGARRIVFESAYGAGSTRKGFYGRALWTVVPGNMKDKETAEAYLRGSGLDWVVVRPVYLTNGLKTGNYRTGIDVPVSGARPSVSRADVADFMLKQLVDNAFLGQAPTISY